MRKIYTIGFIAFFTAGTAFAQSNEVSITPLKDNSIYEEGDLSNGAGEHLFTGVIKTGERRRALLAFDLNGVLPEGTTIDSAKLMLQPTKLKSNGDPMHLHLLLNDWGEGTS